MSKHDLTHFFSMNLSSRKEKRKKRQRLWNRNFSRFLEVLETRALLAVSVSGPSTSNHEEEPPAFVSRIITPQTLSNSTASQYPSVGLVGDTRGSFCTGTLISREFVLTAAHCAEGVENAAGRFIVGGQTYGTSQVIVHPDYSEGRLGTDSANDIALFKLNRQVTNVTPSPIFRGTPTVGQNLTLVGFGGGRNATGGSDGSFGTKRVGITPIDRVSRTIVGWRYDNLSESNTAPGDSGGPAFLNVSNVFYVAGVTSGGSSANAGIGDNSFDTRVDAYQAWIDSILGTSGAVTPSLPTVSIVASDSNASETRSEQATNGGSLIITRNGSLTSALSIRLAISGSASNGADYAAISSVVTIPANRSSITINVLPQDDSLSEGTETAVFALGSDSGYNVDAASGTATITIADNDGSKSNDRFVDRQSITGSFVSISGTNVLASRESGEPNVAGVSGGKSIWYSWTATASGTVTLTTTGSSFDTTLGVYTGSSLGKLRLVTSNDDDDLNAGALTSRAVFSAVAGTTYQFLIDGYAGASGRVNLTLNQGARQRNAEVSNAVSNSQGYPAPPIQMDRSRDGATYHHAASNTLRDLLFASLRRW